MKTVFAILAAAGTLAVCVHGASAAIPPAPAQAIAAAQGAPTPQAGVAPGTVYNYVNRSPSNPAAVPLQPGTNPSQYRWSDDRWWYWSPQGRWLAYGQNGWYYPPAQAQPDAQSMPSGYIYPSTTSPYYSYPGYGNYYPSRFLNNNGGAVGNTGTFVNPGMISNPSPFNNPGLISNPNPFSNQGAIGNSGPFARTR